MLIASAVCMGLLVASLLNYLQGAREVAVGLVARQCLEQGDCPGERVARLHTELLNGALLPAFLDTRRQYTSGLIYDLLAQNEALPRGRQLAMRRRAVAAFAQAVKARPLSGHGWFALGNDALLVGRFREAEEAFSNLLEVDPYPPFHLDFLRLTLRYSRLWQPGFLQRLHANQCALLRASDWGGKYIRMAVTYRMSGRIRNCLHNDWQRAMLDQAMEGATHAPAR